MTHSRVGSHLNEGELQLYKMFFQMSTLKFNAVNYRWCIRDDYSNANEFMSRRFARIITSEHSIFGSLFDLKRTANEDFGDGLKAIVMN